MQRIDALAQAVADELGADAEVSVPDVPGRNLDMLGGADPAGLLRLVATPERSALIIDPEPGWPCRQGRPSGAAELIARVNWLAATGLGRPRDRPLSFALVHLRQGWENRSAAAQVIEEDMRSVEKYALPEGGDVGALLDRIPTLDRLWQPTAPIEPAWLTGICSGPLGPLAEVGIALDAAPGLLVLSGGNSSGKSLLLGALERGMTDSEGPVEASFSEPFALGDLGAHFLRRGPLSVPPEGEEAMARFRRMMRYGDENGALFLPIALESAGFQRLEQLGLALTRSAALPPEAGMWPGLVLDVPTQGIDEMRAHHLRQVIAGLARSRQVVVSCRSRTEASQWEHVAREVGSRASSVDLNEGRALLRPSVQAAMAGPRR